jgi:hypothetical protein
VSGPPHRGPCTEKDGGGTVAPAVNVHVISLFCSVTEHWTGADEPYLTFNNVRLGADGVLQEGVDEPAHDDQEEALHNEHNSREDATVMSYA